MLKWCAGLWLFLGEMYEGQTQDSQKESAGRQGLLLIPGGNYSVEREERSQAG